MTFTSDLCPRPPLPYSQFHSFLLGIRKNLQLFLLSLERFFNNNFLNGSNFLTSNEEVIVFLLLLFLHHLIFHADRKRNNSDASF